MNQFHLVLYTLCRRQRPSATIKIVYTPGKGLTFTSRYQFVDPKQIAGLQNAATDWTQCLRIVGL